MGANVRREVAALTISLAWLVSGIAAAEIVPLSPHPEPNSLRPGLAVTYYYDFYRHIDDVSGDVAEGGGVGGDPLLGLNYRVGDGMVLTATRNDGVGAHIRGLIHLGGTGTYLFALESNDGVRLSLCGETLIEDPDIHSDQWSEVATINVNEPGWYPIELLYFERKSTATLRLVWKNPEIGASGKFEPVPEDVFFHIANE